MKYKTLLIVSAAAVCTFAEGIRVGADLGVSNSNVLGTNLWKTGFAGTVNLFFAPSDNIVFGLRTAYNRWSPIADSFISQLPIALTSGEINGSGTVWELVPALRITTNIAQSQVGLFGHFGAGLYIVTTNINGKGNVDGTSFSQKLVDSRENLWGVSAGMGISFGRFSGFGLEFLPVYHVLDINNSPRQYYTITLGLSYEFYSKRHD